MHALKRFSAALESIDMMVSLHSCLRRPLARCSRSERIGGFSVRESVQKLFVQPAGTQVPRSFISTGGVSGAFPNPECTRRSTIEVEAKQPLSISFLKPSVMVPSGLEEANFCATRAVKIVSVSL